MTNIPLSNLFDEKSLYQAFVISRSFPKSTANKIVYGVTAICALIIIYLWIVKVNTQNSFDVTIYIADMAFNVTVQILGFLIGGFAIFATVSSPDIMIQLANAKMTDMDVSVFKYIFFNFLSVFFVYISTLSVAVIIKVIGNLNIISLYDITCDENMANLILTLVNSMGFFIMLTMLTWSLVRIKSFIWNVYQAFLTFVLTANLSR